MTTDAIQLNLRKERRFITVVMTQIMNVKLGKMLPTRWQTDDEEKDFVVPNTKTVEPNTKTVDLNVSN